MDRRRPQIRSLPSAAVRGRPIAMPLVAVVAVLTGCGSSKAEDAGAIARLEKAGFKVACDTQSDLLKGGAGSGPAVPTRILQRGDLVVAVIRADSAEQAKTAGAVRVHRSTKCPRDRGTLGHRVFGRAVVFAAAAEGGRPSRDYVAAAIHCAEQEPCEMPAARAAVEPHKKKKRRK